MFLSHFWLHFTVESIKTRVCRKSQLKELNSSLHPSLKRPQPGICLSSGVKLTVLLFLSVNLDPCCLLLAQFRLFVRHSQLEFSKIWFGFSKSLEFYSSILKIFYLMDLDSSNKLNIWKQHLRFHLDKYRIKDMHRNHKLYW